MLFLRRADTLSRTVPSRRAGQQRRPLKIHQQRRAGIDLVAQLDGSANELGEVVGEQSLQITADIDPTGAHHLHPRPVRVVLAWHDLDIRSGAAAHHEVADPQAKGLAQAHPGLREQCEQQPVAQVPPPVTDRGVRHRAAVQDRLDLGGQKQRRATALPLAPDPDQRGRSGSSPGVQVREQAPGRGPARCPAHEPARDRHREDRLLPAVEGDQRGQSRLQRPRIRGLFGLDQGVLDGAAIAQPGQEPGDRRDPEIAPPAGLVTLFEERPPLGQRGRIAADRVRRPQLPMGLQPVLDRRHRPVLLVDHGPRPPPVRGPDRHAVRH